MGVPKFKVQKFFVVRMESENIDAFQTLSEFFRLFFQDNKWTNCTTKSRRKHIHRLSKFFNPSPLINPWVPANGKGVKSLNISRQRGVKGPLTSLLIFDTKVCSELKWL